VTLVIRPARPEDVSAISRVLIASITELCVADHHHDPVKLTAWTRNKSVEGVSALLANPDMIMFVAEHDIAIAAVGAVTREGGIALNYIAPEARFSGISKAMLMRLEAELVALGFTEGQLEATRTARRFYDGAGWIADGPQATGRKVNGYPMRKRLIP
jgi:GNAT superfamily N-acetyltransferase